VSRWPAFAFALLGAIGPARGAENDAAWMAPLLEAAGAAIADQPEVRRAHLEVARARIQVDAEYATWRPLASASGRHAREVMDNRPPHPFRRDQDPRNLRSLTFEDAARPRFDHRHDQRTGVELRLIQELPTGTALTLSSESDRDDANDAELGDRIGYTQRVALGVSQELLRGTDPDANLAPIEDARQAIADGLDAEDETVEERFAALLGDWIELSRIAAQVDLARARVTRAEEEHRKAEVLAEEQKDTRSVLSRKRDLLEQAAVLARQRRRLDSARERFALNWPDLAIPADMQPATPTWEPAAIAYRATRDGRIRMRAIDAAERRLAVLQDRGRDRLTLDADFGYEGRHRDYSKAWRELGLGRDYDWSVGLTYEHRFGGTADRHRARAQRLAVGQARETFAEEGRDWAVRAEALSLAYEDALATIAENLEILEAIRAELEVVEERAEGGLVDVRELLRAQDQFRNAEQRLLDLRFDAYAAEIELRAHLDRLPLPEVDPEKTAGGAEGTEGRGEGGADPGDPEDVEGEEEDVGRGDDR